MYVCREKEVEM